MGCAAAGSSRERGEREDGKEVKIVRLASDATESVVLARLQQLEADRYAK